MEEQLPNAFAAAESLGFSVFFSFDYARNGPWDKETVKYDLRTYAKSRYRIAISDPMHWFANTS